MKCSSNAQPCCDEFNAPYWHISGWKQVKILSCIECRYTGTECKGSSCQDIYGFSKSYRFSSEPSQFCKIKSIILISIQIVSYLYDDMFSIYSFYVSCIAFKIKKNGRKTYLLKISSPHFLNLTYKRSMNFSSPKCLIFFFV